MTDAQSLIITQATNAGSSSAEAYALAFPTNRNRTNTGSLYIKSGATVQKTYSTNTYEVLNPTSADLHTRGQRKTVMVSADSSFNSLIDARVAVGIDTSHLSDASVSPNFNTIQASKFTTTYSNGTVLVIGDDSKIVDVNLSNGMGIVGQQQNNRGWVKFGTNGPLWGHNGNQATLPAPGDGLYAVTGSLMVSASKLMFYNGNAAGTNGWTAIK